MRTWPQSNLNAISFGQQSFRGPQGFLHGLNEILILGAALSFAGSLLALWLVRERDIEREPVVEPAPEGAIEAQPQAAQA